MQRALASCLVVAAFASCDDQVLRAPPTADTSPTGTATTAPPADPPDSGADDGAVVVAPPTGPWGDPKTTHRPGVLRLEQLNVRRFFDTICDSNDCTGTTAYEDVLTPAKFDARATQIANALATIQADVITLAEIEKQDCLDAVKAKLEAAGYSYPVAYLAETGGTGSIDVAILARGTLGPIVTHRQTKILEADGVTKTTFTRELPEVHLTFGDKSVIVFAAHFKAKTDPDDPARRQAEGHAAHDIMVATGKANPASLVLLGGDLNDTPGTPPIDALEGDGALLRVAKDVTEQGTYYFSGKLQPIDHIFTTTPHASSYVAKSSTVVQDPGKRGFAGSDHATIWADFTLP